MAHLLRYHNMGATHSPYTQAEVLVGMCMDHHEGLSLPENFAYIIRSAGCNSRYSEFQISYAVAMEESPRSLSSAIRTGGWSI
ncbi:MAG: hypothetical protein ABIR36_15005 [Nitrospiraceae bacterium]